MRLCKKCGIVKEDEDFYKSKSIKSGFRTPCKECTQKKNKEWAKNNYGRIREYVKEYTSKDGWRDKSNSYNREYHQKNKNKCCKYKRELYHKNIEHNKVRGIFHNEVKSGRIKRQPCVHCGSLKSQGHHPDYSKPLEVIWVCSAHHYPLYHTENLI